MACPQGVVRTRWMVYRHLAVRVRQDFERGERVRLVERLVVDDPDVAVEHPQGVADGRTVPDPGVGLNAPFCARHLPFAFASDPVQDGSTDRPDERTDAD